MSQAWLTRARGCAVLLPGLLLVPGGAAAKLETRLDTGRVGVLGAPADASADDRGAADDAMALASLSLEELLDVQVTAVSRFPQRLRNTAAAVNIITREQIRTFGYRTLGEIVAAFPGTQVSNDRLYRYIAVGGISPPNDFNGRFLVLIDGQRLNNALYDSIPAGTDFILDIEQIERIEFLRGPSSATYGNNALFGVFNIITIGGTPDRLLASAAAGSLGEERYRVEINRLFDSAVAVRASASYQRLDGYRTRAAGSLPAIDGADGEHNTALEFSAQRGGMRFAVVHGERVKRVPLPYYDAVPGDERNSYNDSEGFVSLSGDFQPLTAVALQGRLYYSYYDFKGTYPIDYGPDAGGVVANQDRAKSRSAGGEAQFRYTGLSGHTVVGGLSGQQDFILDQTNFDVEPPALYIDSQSKRTRYGVNLQDDWQLTPAINVSYGGRYDNFDDFGGVFSPRVGAVWTPAESQTVKFSFGRAFRAPNAFERFGYLIGNPQLEPERATSADLLWEGFPTSALRVQAGLHHIDFEQQISPLESGDGNAPGGDARFQNLGKTRSLALNLEGEYRWVRGLDLKLSGTVQDVENHAGETPNNAPRWLAKAQLSTPLPMLRARAGLELRSTAGREASLGGVDAFTLLNFTLSDIPLGYGLVAHASVYNLLDDRYRDPITGLESFGVDYAEDAGRTFRVTVEGRI